MFAALDTTRILVVEDNPDVVSLLERVLVEQGYEVQIAVDGNAGLARATHAPPDLVILDVGLPGRNGFEVASELRRRGVSAPVLMLTARGNVADRVNGLDAGADDYLPKPFDPDELLARVRALVRRAALRARAARLVLGDLALDPLAREVWHRGRPLSLSPREFSLLEYMMRNPGRPLSRAAIVTQVWKQTEDAETSNIVDVYMAYLRRKLNDDAATIIQTVRGVGYVLRVPGADPPPGD